MAGKKAKDFEVDYVVPFVTQSDPYWRRSYKRQCVKEGKDLPDPKEYTERYRDWENLQYVFRGIEKYMPWIRTIHLILYSPSQVPKWLNTDKVHVVYHKDFIPKRFRPCFSSCTIEAFLPRIKGIAEHFIYANDDFFPFNPIEKGDFFDLETGLPRFDVVLEPRGDKTGRMFLMHCLNATYLFKDEFDLAPLHNKVLRVAHCMQPLLYSDMQEVYRRHKQQIYDSISTFRSAKNINQYIFANHLYLSGKTRPGHRSNIYLDFKNKTLGQVLKELRTTDGKVLCINDAGIEQQFVIAKTLINMTLEQRLPHKSRYER